MMRIFAPGKLVVLGEYAVLYRGGAIVAAVDRGVVCTVSEGDSVETPGDDRFARAGLRAAEAPPRCYLFSDAVPWTLGGKPGFGGSAAAVVSACAAGLAAREADGTPLLQLAQEAHLKVQGSGSGLDVRASVEGDLRRVQGDQSTLLPALELSAIYSGRSAQTGPRVARYLAWENRAAFVSDSAALVQSFDEDPVAALREAGRLLAAMAVHAGIDYTTPALGRIAELAAEHGGAAKPSGAGGGDIAVAWIPDPTARDAFHIACAAQELVPVPVALSPGVHLRASNV
jgi:phosphomevalonate kinase